jgi:PAS domain S-box-containing protein
MQRNLMVVTRRADGWRQLFEAVFERSSNPMSVITGDRVIVRVNGAKARLLARSEEDMVGQRLEAFVAPEYREEVVRLWMRAAEHGKKLVGEYDMVRGDGSHVHVRFAAEPVDLNGDGMFVYLELPETADDALTPSDDDDDDVAGTLTKREREVVHLLALGGTGPDIAAELVLSHDTVRTHIRNAMAKTGARTRAALVAIALGDELL